MLVSLIDFHQVITEKFHLSLNRLSYNYKKFSSILLQSSSESIELADD